MTLAKIREFIEKAVAKFVMADSIINGLQAQNALLTAQVAALTAAKEQLEAMIAALQADDAEALATIQAAIDALEPAVVPELTPEEQAGLELNDESNPQQMEEAIVELAVEMPEADFEDVDAPTMGTIDETPTDTIEAATEAIAEALASESIDDVE